jgi:hypothetical protein
MNVMKSGDTELVRNGGYVFEGELLSEGVTYKKGEFISQQKTVKALNDAVLLSFKTVAGIEFKNQERISVFNQS